MELKTRYKIKGTPYLLAEAKKHKKKTGSSGETSNQVKK
eukprot:SAG22_NODE_124_length_18884_cov_34.149367_4_plen_39_part_00